MHREVNGRMGGKSQINLVLADREAEDAPCIATPVEGFRHLGGRGEEVRQHLVLAHVSMMQLLVLLSVSSIVCEPLDIRWCQKKASSG